MSSSTAIVNEEPGHLAPPAAVQDFELFKPITFGGQLITGPALRQYDGKFTESPLFKSVIEKIEAMPKKEFKNMCMTIIPKVQAEADSNLAMLRERRAEKKAEIQDLMYELMLKMYEDKQLKYLYETAIDERQNLADVLVWGEATGKSKASIKSIKEAAEKDRAAQEKKAKEAQDAAEPEAIDKGEKANKGKKKAEKQNEHMAIEVSRLEAAVVEAREIFKRLGLGFWDSDEAEERSKSKKRAR